MIHWAVWVMKEFNIDEMEIGAIHIPGRELCSFTHEEFLQKVPSGEILWSHLELLRKCRSRARRERGRVGGCGHFLTGKRRRVFDSSLMSLLSSLVSLQTCWPVRTKEARTPL